MNTRNKPITWLINEHLLWAEYERNLKHSYYFKWVYGGKLGYKMSLYENLENMMKTLVNVLHVQNSSLWTECLVWYKRQGISLVGNHILTLVEEVWSEGQ